MSRGRPGHTYDGNIISGDANVRFGDQNNHNYYGDQGGGRNAISTAANAALSAAAGVLTKMALDWITLSVTAFLDRNATAKGNTRTTEAELQEKARKAVQDGDYEKALALIEQLVVIRRANEAIRRCGERSIDRPNKEDDILKCRRALFQAIVDAEIQQADREGSRRESIALYASDRRGVPRALPSNEPTSYSTAGEWDQPRSAVSPQYPGRLRNADSYLEPQSVTGNLDESSGRGYALMSNAPAYDTLRPYPPTSRGQEDRSSYYSSYSSRDYYEPRTRPIREPEAYRAPSYQQPAARRPELAYNSMEQRSPGSLNRDCSTRSDKTSSPDGQQAIALAELDLE